MAEHGESHWWYRATRALLQQLVEPHLSHDAAALNMDAGGGTGATGRWLCDNAPTVLADFEEFALHIARSDTPGYVPTRADLNQLPFNDDSFSAVLCVTALCHRMNPDPAAIVADFARLARPGAVIALMEPGGKKLWRGHDDVTHTARRFSLAEMREMAEGAGLVVQKATGAYSFLVPPAYLIGRFERKQSNSDVGRNESGLFGLFALLAAAERWWLRRFRIPFGLSAIVIARKPG